VVITITTPYPQVVIDLLTRNYDMIEKRHIEYPLHLDGFIIHYPQGAVSQELGFWFYLAEGCGIVTKWEVGP
jgi:hypothetical protein